MHGPVHKLAALLVCCTLIPLTGCAATSERANGLFAKMFSKETPEQKLHIKTPDDRIKELKQLAKVAKKKTPEEQQPLVGALSEEYRQENIPSVRRQLLKTLALFPQPQALATIVSGLEDKDLETRRMACSCLGMRGGEDSVRELTRIISSDTNVDVRLAAVRAMGGTRDKGALMPLAEALVDPDPAVQARAEEGLTTISGRHFGNNVEAWKEYAQTGASTAPEMSVAERLHRAFY